MHSLASEQLLAQAERGAQLGSEFGKASPIGLLVIVLMLVVVLYLGMALARRVRVMNRRRAFAEEHGLDPFDIDGIDAAMQAAGLGTAGKRRWL